MAIVYRLQKRSNQYIWICTQFVDLDMCLNLALKEKRNFPIVFQASGHSRYMPRLSEMNPDTWLMLLVAALVSLYTWCCTYGTLVFV